jgi:HPt (histidine-containing phosphotransfer) domain-containing protein
MKARCRAYVPVEPGKMTLHAESAHSRGTRPVHDARGRRDRPHRRDRSRSRHQPTAALDPTAFGTFAAIGDDAALLHESIATFTSDAAERIASLRTAAATPNAEVLRTVAHTLRGSSSGLGAASMVELCQRLETRASVLSAPEAVRLVAELERELARVREALSERQHTS